MAALPGWRDSLTFQAERQAASWDVLDGAFRALNDRIYLAIPLYAFTRLPCIPTSRQKNTFLAYPLFSTTCLPARLRRARGTLRRLLPTYLPPLPAGTARHFLLPFLPPLPPRPPTIAPDAARYAQLPPPIVPWRQLLPPLNQSRSRHLPHISNSPVPCCCAHLPYAGVTLTRLAPTCLAGGTSFYTVATPRRLFRRLPGGMGRGRGLLYTTAAAPAHLTHQPEGNALRYVHQVVGQGGSNACPTHSTAAHLRLQRLTPTYLRRRATPSQHLQTFSICHGTRLTFPPYPLYLPPLTTKEEWVWDLP